MTTPSSRYQLLRRGDRYAVRTRGWFGIWWYWGYEDRMAACWFTPSWHDREAAKSLHADLTEWDAKRAAFKAAKTEVVKP